MGLLSAGLGILANNTGHYGAAMPALAAGGLAGIQGYQGARQAQIDEEARQVKLAQLRQQQEQAARAAAYRQSLASGAKLNPMEAYAAGLSLDDVQKLAESGNWGKSKVKDYKEVRKPDGTVEIVGYDEFGNPVSTGATPFKAPEFRDLGGQVVGIDPITLKPVWSGAKTMTPGEAASNAIARANLGISQARLAMDRAGPANNPMLKGAPAGYRWNAQGNLEPIPGGPAEVGKAPTEFQGKSAVYGARASEADKIISGLQGKYSPAAIGAKQAASDVPVIGGLLGAAGNVLMSPESQKAEQAQRDFINAMLRQESGAAISPSEFDNARKQYFPQPGDSNAVIAQKARNRAIAIQGLQSNAGKANYTPAAPNQSGGWSAKRID
ncbi:hypothetical protein [Cupriavidus gilardii]|uniref:hypothetical protein n=1 Tax=Cupriavidus gilardii TaxID=82541 RepID=UPI0021C02C66|nr:hypothetical protein [Cupriavidus gilardii]MCT9125415.1 hypothetical protein [Cupriavidus gilardii]